MKLHGFCFCFVSLGLVASLLLGTTAEANLLRGSGELNTAPVDFFCVDDKATCDEDCKHVGKQCLSCPPSLGGGWMCPKHQLPKPDPAPLGLPRCIDKEACEIKCKPFHMHCLPCHPKLGEGWFCYPPPPFTNMVEAAPAPGDDPVKFWRTDKAEAAPAPRLKKP
eukprot:RCo003981